MQEYARIAFICIYMHYYARYVSMKFIRKICKNMHPPVGPNFADEAPPASEAGRGPLSADRRWS